MKILLLTTIAMLSTIPAGAAEPPKTDAAPEGLDCFANLTAPEFPMDALRARVDGDAWVNIQVNSGGAIDKVETQVVSAWSSAAKLLTAPVEKAVRAATFKPACYGRTVSTVFRYQLYGDPVANPQATSKADGPRMMLIQSQPAVATNSTAKSAAK